jgi:hypothetical protein
VFWEGGSHGAGHIAITAGRFLRITWCRSSDIKRLGWFNRVPIALISRKWGLTLLGTTKDLNGDPIR